MAVFLQKSSRKGGLDRMIETFSENAQAFRVEEAS